MKIVKFLLFVIVIKIGINATSDTTLVYARSSKKSESDKKRSSATTGEPKIKLAISDDGAFVEITISKTEFAKGYHIYMKSVDDEDFRQIKILRKNGSKKRKYNVKNLKRGEYEFFVTAYVLEGKERVEGLSSEHKHISFGVNRTVKKANAYDYSVTMNDSGERLSEDEINKNFKGYGTYTGVPGMPTEEYTEAMEYQWKDVTRKRSKWKKTEVSLTEKYTYKNLVTLMRKLSAYEGVRLYIIGKSTSGKTMYALDVDLTNCAWEDRHTVLLTGQVHARETAGPVYILRELADILNAYLDGDEKAIKTLSTTRFVAVPCVNPDGHDGIGFDLKNWKYSGGDLWKATSNGTDINRNFPGLSWMQLKDGVEKTKLNSSSPAKLHYCGEYAGSIGETKAMMKFYQYFVGVQQAEILVDYHQQGRITYAGKAYAPAENIALSEALRKACGKTQEKGPLGKRYLYDNDDTEENYGLHGGCSTNTDYAWAVAVGAVFSTQYGFSVYVDEDGNEYPLIMVPVYSKAEKVNGIGMRSPKFRTISWEIGDGSDYLGYSSNARKLIEKEYFNYNFDEMLYTYATEAAK